MSFSEEQNLIRSEPHQTTTSEAIPWEEVITRTDIVTSNTSAALSTGQDIPSQAIVSQRRVSWIAPINSEAAHKILDMKALGVKPNDSEMAKLTREVHLVRETLAGGIPTVRTVDTQGRYVAFGGDVTTIPTIDLENRPEGLVGTLGGPTVPYDIPIGDGWRLLSYDPSLTDTNLISKADLFKSGNNISGTLYVDALKRRVLGLIQSPDHTTIKFETDRESPNQSDVIFSIELPIKEVPSSIRDVAKSKDVTWLLREMFSFDFDSNGRLVRISSGPSRAQFIEIFTEDDFAPEVYDWIGTLLGIEFDETTYLDNVKTVQNLISALDQKEPKSILNNLAFKKVIESTFSKHEGLLP